MQLLVYITFQHHFEKQPRFWGFWGKNQVTKQLFFGGHQGFFGVFGKIRQSLAPVSGKYQLNLNLEVLGEYEEKNQLSSVYVK